MTGSTDGNITIGEVWGIPIRINPSLFLILALLTWSLADTLLPAAYPEMSRRALKSPAETRPRRTIAPT